MKFIRTLLIVIVAAVSFAGSALAQPALYIVHDDDTTIYVLGTFHLMRPGATWRDARIDAALASSDAFYFEADAWGVDPAEMQAVVLGAGMYPQGETLPSHLTSDQWVAVSDMAISLNLPPQALQQMRPWFAAINIAALIGVSEGFDPNLGVDATLYNELRASGRELRFFETFEDQIHFLSHFGEDIQVKMLMETVSNPAANEGQFDRMYNAWAAGDLDQLDEIGNGEMRRAYPEVYEAIIANRNRQWVADLTALMGERGTFFVAVGALHLPGDEGVISLMESRGFTVVRQ